MNVDLYVHGDPAPQGSKRHMGRGRLVESSKRVQPWREAIVSEVLRCGLADTMLDEACLVEATFYFTRPAAHYGANGLKATAPTRPTRRSAGDIDKLARSTLDGLVQAGLLTDDSLVVDLIARKRYATERLAPGAAIRIASGEIHHAFTH